MGKMAQYAVAERNCNRFKTSGEEEKWQNRFSTIMIAIDGDLVASNLSWHTHSVRVNIE